MFHFRLQKYCFSATYKIAMFGKKVAIFTNILKNVQKMRIYLHSSKKNTIFAPEFVEL